MLLSIIGNKGGTGKTTSAVNLAAALALKGRRALLLDLDAQASASLSLGIDRAALSPSMADVILDGRGLAGIIRRTTADGLDLSTGSPELADADLRLSARAGRELRLKEAVEPIRGAYDFILADCPPSLGLLAINALTAADALIIPCPPEYLALEGLVGMIEAINNLGQPPPLYVLLTRVDRRRRVTAETVELIRGHFGRQVLKAEIRVDVKLVEAPSFGKTIFQYDRRSSGALSYAAAADEIIRRVKR